MIDTIFIEFCNTIQKHNLWQENETILLSISGGADSIALLDLCTRYRDQYKNIYFILATFDHRLRKDSQKEVQIVKQLCHSRGIPCYSQEFHLDSAMPSMEQKAREKRYTILEQIAIECNATKIAVGHHSDDQIETILFHFLKGTGIRGLAGMLWKRPLTPNSKIFLIRPLLGFEKQILQQYLQKRQLTWLEDPSNQDTKYSRNHLRQIIIPYLKNNRYPNLQQSCLQTAQHAQGIITDLEQQANIWVHDHVQYKYTIYKELNMYFETIFGKKNCIMIHNIACETIPQALLPFCLTKIIQHFSSKTTLRETHYNNFTTLQTQKNGILQYPENITIYKESDYTYFLRTTSLHIQPISEIWNNLQDSQRIYSKIIPWNEQNTISKSTLEITLDKAKVHFPLQFRQIQKNDSIFPLGAKGVKKVNRLLSDKKILSTLRPFITILVDKKGQGLWIPGICIAEFTKIKKQTTQAILLRFH